MSIEAEVPVSVRVEVTRTASHTATSSDGSDALNSWKNDPEMPVLVSLLPSASQGPRPNNHHGADSKCHSGQSGSEERRRHGKTISHSQSHSRPSSPIDHSSHRSQRSVDLESSGIRPRPNHHSSGDRSDPISPASKEANDLDADYVFPSQEELISHAGDSFPGAQEPGVTTDIPQVIDVPLGTPTQSSLGSSSSGTTWSMGRDKSSVASNGARSI